MQDIRPSNSKGCWPETWPDTRVDFFYHKNNFTEYRICILPAVDNQFDEIVYISIISCPTINDVSMEKLVFGTIIC